MNSKSKLIIICLMFFASIAIIIATFVLYANNSTVQTNARNSNYLQIKIINETNIYSSPIMDSKIVGTVFNGEIYTVLNSYVYDSYKWYEIETNQGIRGFITNKNDDTLELPVDKKSEIVSSTVIDRTSSDVISSVTDIPSSVVKDDKSSEKIKDKVSSKIDIKSDTISSKVNDVVPLKPMDAKLQYTCDDGWKQDGPLCIKFEYSNIILEEACPMGFEIKISNDGTKKCIGYTKPNIPIKKNLTCSSGNASDIITTPNGYSCKNGEVIYDLYCPYGYEKLNDTTCKWKFSGEERKIGNNCPLDYPLADSENKKCYKRLAVSATETYSCPKGYYLKNNKCYRK